MVPVAVPPMVAERFDDKGAMPDAGFAVKLVMVKVGPEVVALLGEFETSLTFGTSSEVFIEKK